MRWCVNMVSFETRYIILDMCFCIPVPPSNAAIHRNVMMMIKSVRKVVWLYIFFVLFVWSTRSFSWLVSNGDISSVDDSKDSRIEFLARTPNHMGHSMNDICMDAGYNVNVNCMMCTNNTNYNSNTSQNTFLRNFSFFFSSSSSVKRKFSFFYTRKH